MRGPARRKDLPVSDPGFVCYYRGWQRLRGDDLGPLWEHLVLNEIQARLQSRKIHYWRDKQGHEVDFVLTPRRGAPVALECKWSADDFDPRNLKVFRRHYPRGRNLVVAKDVDRPFRNKYDDIEVEFLSLPSARQQLQDD